MMPFSELKECPFCGSDMFCEKQKVKGYIYPNMRFDGKEDGVHNEDLYDSIDVIYNGRAYCCQCKQYLGNYIDGTISKAAEKKIKSAYSRENS
jgi:hypothetical protein